MARKRHHKKSTYATEVARERKMLAKASHKSISELSKLTHMKKKSVLGRTF
jgi:hypothetical protein